MLTLWVLFLSTLPLLSVIWWATLAVYWSAQSMTGGQSKRLAKRRASGSIDAQDRFSDWDKENVDISRQVPISAPVPVWCASLGKDALKTILAMGEEGMCPEWKNLYIWGWLPSARGKPVDWSAYTPRRIHVQKYRWRSQRPGMWIPNLRYSFSFGRTESNDGYPTYHTIDIDGTDWPLPHGMVLHRRRSEPCAKQSIDTKTAWPQSRSTVCSIARWNAQAHLKRQSEQVGLLRFVLLLIKTYERVDSNSGRFGTPSCAISSIRNQEPAARKFGPRCWPDSRR